MHVIIFMTENSEPPYFFSLAAGAFVLTTAYLFFLSSFALIVLRLRVRFLLSLINE